MSKILEKNEILTLAYGNQTLNGRAYAHTGIDVVGEGYTACHVKALMAGKVIEKAYQANGYGNYVVIDHENGYLTRYAHLADPAGVNVGDRVEEGQVFGYMGDTGYAFGVHLHFEIISGAIGFRCIDPEPYIFGNEKLPSKPEEPKQPTEYAHKVGELVVYSSCYRGNNDVPPNYIDCIKEYGAWQQRHIKEVVGGKNPYKLDNGLFVNDGDIRMVK